MGSGAGDGGGAFVDVGAGMGTVAGGRVGAGVSVSVGCAVAVACGVGSTGNAVGGALVGVGDWTDVGVREGGGVNVGLGVIVGTGGGVGVCGDGLHAHTTQPSTASAMHKARIGGCLGRDRRRGCRACRFIMFGKPLLFRTFAWAGWKAGTCALGSSARK